MNASVHFILLIQTFMNTDINQRKHGVKVSRDVPIDQEFDLHLFEAFLNDRIENEILRMIKYCGENPQIE